MKNENIKMQIGKLFPLYFAFFDLHFHFASSNYGQQPGG